MTQCDFLLIGDGLAGSLLAYRLQAAGASVLLLGKPEEAGASRVAAGLCNPITGRRMGKTWLADTLFPFLHRFYPALEHELSTRFFYPRSIYRPFRSEKARRKWLREEQEKTVAFAEVVEAGTVASGIHDTWGGVAVREGGFVDTNTLLDALRAYLSERGAYRAAAFAEDDLRLTEAGAQWQDIAAEKVIFCRGAADRHSAYWSHLPFDVVKGEILDVNFIDAPRDLIVNQGCWVFRHPSGVFKVGATYDRQNFSTKPTLEGRADITKRLERLVSWAYQVVDQRAGVRPATRDHRPFVGLHPEHPQLGIFNGFGSKGCTLMPYFSEQFVRFLEYGEALLPEVRVDATR